MSKTLVLLIIFFTFFSCINYLPCRGQDYLVENITNEELIKKFIQFRKAHPEYYVNKDRKDEYIPHYYIDLYWKDLDLIIRCDIHIGNEIPNPPTHLNFTFIRDSKGYKDINSKNIDKVLNEKYKNKFETEILDKLGIKWKRKKCW